MTNKVRRDAVSPTATGGGSAAARRPGYRLAAAAVVAYAAAVVATGVLLDLAAAVLALAFGVLVAAIGIFWASLRALSDDVPITVEDALLLGSPSAAEEEKRAVLQALRDLEYERSVGKVSERDYEELLTRYRAQAKQLLRLLDEDLAPQRQRAETFIARELGGKKEGAGSHKAKKRDVASTDGFTPGARAEGCPSCRTSNDADAIFCKKCGKRLAAAVLLVFALTGLTLTKTARAAGRDDRAPTAASSPSAPRSGGAAPTGTAGRLPPGHPPIPESAERDDRDDQGPAELPPGHPPTTGRVAPDGGLQGPPEDTTTADAALPPGTLVVDVCDGEERPRARVPLTLGILSQTVARSDARQQIAGVTDDTGIARFAGLPTGATASYRVTVATTEPDGAVATFASPPFRLELTRGQRVRLHVYPVETRLEAAMIGMQAAAYFEVRDELVEITEFYEIYNLGKSAWVPREVSFSLPPGAKAFQTDVGMGAAGLELDGTAVRLRGTFPPGQYELQARFQVPYDGSGHVSTQLELLPRVARMRVMAETTRDTRLSVPGFSVAKAERNARGQRVLVVDRQQRTGEQPLARAEVTLENLPTAGGGRYWAVAIAGALGAWGMYEAFFKRSAQRELREREHEVAEARRQLLSELEVLVFAEKSGQIGPRAYARARQELVDALARLLPV